LYAILAVFITDQVIGHIVEGRNDARAAWVISEQPDGVSRALQEKPERGIEVFLIEDAGADRRRKIIFCIFSQKEVQSVKSIIMNIDKNAFFVLTDIREVFKKDTLYK
jgi:uncharacterized membrane-anchored protein YitT (DUF2179 family)